MFLVPPRAYRPSIPLYTSVVWRMYMYICTNVPPTQCLEAAFYLYEKGIGEEVSVNYLKLAQNLEEYIGKMFNEWVVTVEKELARHLETQLMAKIHNNKYGRAINYNGGIKGSLKPKFV